MITVLNNWASDNTWETEDITTFRLQTKDGEREGDYEITQVNNNSLVEIENIRPVNKKLTSRSKKYGTYFSDKIIVIIIMYVAMN